MLDPMVKAMVELVDSIAGMFHLGHAAEKHVARGSVVGESKLDDEVRDRQERLLRSWQLVSAAIVLLLAGAGVAVWYLASK